MEIGRILEKLCTCDGVSGCEDSVAECAKGFLREFGAVSIDKLGSVSMHREGSGKHFLIDAHMDQIGLIVTGITDDGFLKVSRCGGTDLRTLTAAQVTVWGKKPVYGIICSKPPHLMSDEESDKAAKCEDIAIDIGFSKEKAQELVSVGDRVSFAAGFERLEGDIVCSKSIDNRAGMAAAIRCLEILSHRESTAEITVNFSVQEETGCTGGGVAAFDKRADFALVTDVSFAKQPGVSENDSSPMGSGAMIAFGPVLDTQMSKELERLARYNKIGYTIEVCPGRTGTNADNILSGAGGVKTAVISMPIKNMHTPVEVVKLSDIEAVAQLMAEFILSKEVE